MLLLQLHIKELEALASPELREDGMTTLPFPSSPGLHPLSSSSAPGPLLWVVLCSQALRLPSGPREAPECV